MRLVRRRTLFFCINAILICIFILVIYKYNQERINKPLTLREIVRLLNNAENDMDDRRRLITKVCSKYNLGLYRNIANESKFKHPPTPQYGVFYLIKSHKIAYCPVYKVATSTWLHQFLLLADGYNEDKLSDSKQQISVLARQVYPQPEPEEAEEAFRNSKKIMMVRHPFERLLSAYRDKLENKDNRHEHGTKHFYESYGKKIVLKYRNDTSITKAEPTFREFVTYLINEDVIKYDDHWLPIYLFCTPCLLNYDIIGHLETMERDQMYTIRVTGLQQNLNPKWRHLTKGKQSSELSIIKQYYSQISKWHLDKLYDKYQLDFELFGYTPYDYYNYVTSV